MAGAKRTKPLKPIRKIKPDEQLYVSNKPVDDMDEATIERELGRSTGPTLLYPIKQRYILKDKIKEANDDLRKNPPDPRNPNPSTKVKFCDKLETLYNDDDGFLKTSSADSFDSFDSFDLGGMIRLPYRRISSLRDSINSEEDGVKSFRQVTEGGNKGTYFTQVFQEKVDLLNEEFTGEDETEEELSELFSEVDLSSSETIESWPSRQNSDGRPIIKAYGTKSGRQSRIEFSRNKCTVQQKSSLDETRTTGCQWCLRKKSTVKLPDYNGLRSEYGLSEVQLLERRRVKMKMNQLRQEKRLERVRHEALKASKKEAVFSNWLANKRRREQWIHPERAIPKQLYFRPISAQFTQQNDGPDTSVRKSQALGLRRTVSATCSLRELRTYHIYLGN